MGFPLARGPFFFSGFKNLSSIESLQLLHSELFNNCQLSPLSHSKQVDQLSVFKTQGSLRVANALFEHQFVIVPWVWLIEKPLYSLRCFPLYSWNRALGSPNRWSWPMVTKHPGVHHHPSESSLACQRQFLQQLKSACLLGDCSCRWTFQPADGAMPLYCMGLTQASWFCIPFVVFINLSVSPHSATKFSIIVFAQ